MRFTPTELDGVYVIEPEPIADERGFFARTWCATELASHGLVAQIAQASVSYNRLAGTLRGMHYTVAPHAESKVVSCARGAIYDVLVDLRPGARKPRWIAVELTAANRQMLFVPQGVAHGFLTLADDTEVSYLISEPYAADCARGVRYSDPAFAIAWPSEPRVISPRDASYPDFSP